MSKEGPTIGVVCEGPTDFLAIRSFLGQSLAVDGVNATFIPLQPNPDEGQQDGGWTKVYTWLTNIEPEVRARKYFKGLFSGNLDAKKCDIILIHLDADIINDPAFRKLAAKDETVKALDLGKPEARGRFIGASIHLWAGMKSLCNADRSRHVIAPAVECIETWCIAACKFFPDDEDVELLREAELANHFMEVLHEVERRPIVMSRSVDKNVERREKFHQKVNLPGGRMRSDCFHYVKLCDRLKQVLSTA